MRIVIRNNLVLNRVPKTIYYHTANAKLSDQRPSTKMAGYLSIFDKNPKRSERIRFLAELFKTNGHELRIAGGAVRDILRGQEPDDIDFATTAKPEQTLEIVNKHEDLLRVIVSNAGLKHGTVAVKFKEAEIDFKRIKLTVEPDFKSVPSGDTEPVYDQENPFEITTLRCDTFTDGRHAEVEFVNDWRVDAERRDLTINAMFLTLDKGDIVDYFNGRKDLENGIVRFVGSAELRIKEDYLRILRFFRFWSRYGGGKRPDEETLTTIVNNLDGFRIISGERIWTEMKKIFTHSPCSEVVKLMLELKVLENIGFKDDDCTNDFDKYKDQISDEIRSIEGNIKKYRDSLVQMRIFEDSHKLSMEKKLKDLFPVVLISTVIRSQKMLQSVHSKMKISNIEKDTIMYIIDTRSKGDLNIKSLKHQLAIMHLPDRAQAMTRMKAVLIYKGLIDWAHELMNWEVPTFHITGSEVAKEFKKRKLPPNKIKIVLSELKDEWADGDFKSSQDELNKLLLEKCDKLENV